LITISYEQFGDRPGCGSIDAHQALTLEVPSDALLHLANIYYQTVQITGPVQGVVAEDIGGYVSIAAAGTVTLRNLGNGVSLGLGPMSTGSVAMESVFGDVELDVTGRRDVEIHASSIVGEFKSIPTDFVRLKTADGDLLKSRAGGTLISLKRIDGDIVLKHR
jgi:hypothetical protein